MHQVEENLVNLPKKAQMACRRTRCISPENTVLMDEAFANGGWLVYSTATNSNKLGDSVGWLHPTVLIVDGKVYGVEDKPRPEQDATDLEYFAEIVDKAKHGREKNQRTCEAILVIKEEFIGFLSGLNWAKVGSEANIRSRRGRIQNAKLTAVRIWREGKLQVEGV